MTFAKQTALAIYSEAANEADDERRKALAKHAVNGERAERLAAMVKLAASEPGIPVLPDELDRDPWLLNVENGTLDLRTGKLRRHDPADLLTKLAPVEFRPEARCPLFFSFLDRIMAGNVSLIEFLQRTLGYTLTGTTRERCLWMFWGGGDNGKSTLLETIAAVLGDYAATAPPRTLMAKRDEGIPNDVARLKGSRFVAAVETAESRRLDVELVKRMTGGVDKLPARFMRGEWFDFQPNFKLFIATNHKPVVKDTTESIWRRIKLVPFAVTILQAEQDKTLPEKLRTELPGVPELATGRLSRQATRRARRPARSGIGYRQLPERDGFARPVPRGRLRDRPTAWVTSADLYKRYCDWCDANVDPHSDKAWNRALGKGLRPRKDHRRTLPMVRNRAPRVNGLNG
jgi:putative DNA primase/helicase